MERDQQGCLVGHRPKHVYPASICFLNIEIGKANYRPYVQIDFRHMSTLKGRMTEQEEREKERGRPHAK
jgi:hypothetical protein